MMSRCDRGLVGECFSEANFRQWFWGRDSGVGVLGHGMDGFDWFKRGTTSLCKVTVWCSSLKHCIICAVAKLEVRKNSNLNPRIRHSSEVL